MTDASPWWPSMRRLRDEARLIVSRDYKLVVESLCAVHLEAPRPVSAKHGTEGGLKQA